MEFQRRLCLLLVVCLPQGVSFADIEWTSATTATGNASDVRVTGNVVAIGGTSYNVGSLMYAGNFTNVDRSGGGAPGNFTVNGVQFLRNSTIPANTFSGSQTITTAGGGVSVSGVQYGYALIPPNMGGNNAGYSNNVWGGVGSRTPLTVTLNNLTQGNRYLIQGWTPAWNSNKSVNFVSGLSSTTLNIGNSNIQTLQYALGTFVATSSTQTYSITQNNGGLEAFAGPIQVRELTAVPEPTSVACILGFIGSAWLRSRRSSLSSGKQWW
jgi:hypothetical protein